MRNFELLYKFGKLKSFEDIPPAYKTSTPTVSEPISLTEAFHIWDHLSLRYDQIQMTALFLGFVHDPDFKLIMQQGLNVLKKQAGKLEQQALTFEVVLPERPPSSMQVPIDPETLKDNFMYATIFNGMLDAVDLHMRAVIETVRHDALRDLFFELLKDEIGIVNNLLRYGKMKGWSRVTPIYGEIVT